MLYFFSSGIGLFIKKLKKKSSSSFVRPKMKLDKVEEAFPVIMNTICVISRCYFARNARQNQEVRGVFNFGMLLIFNSRGMFGERS